MNVMFLNASFIFYILYSIFYICIINTLLIFLFAYIKVDNIFKAWHNFKGKLETYIVKYCLVKGHL